MCADSEPILGNSRECWSSTRSCCPMSAQAPGICKPHSGGLAGYALPVLHGLICGCVCQACKSPPQVCAWQLGAAADPDSCRPEPDDQEADRLLQMPAYQNLGVARALPAQAGPFPKNKRPLLHLVRSNARAAFVLAALTQLLCEVREHGARAVLLGHLYLDAVPYSGRNSRGPRN